MSKETSEKGQEKKAEFRIRFDGVVADGPLYYAVQQRKWWGWKTIGIFQKNRAIEVVKELKTEVPLDL